MMTTILVIEDDVDIRADIIGMLDLEGYETLEAADGVEGLKLAFTHSPDLILCDVMMPRIDGYEVLLQIRLNPKTWLIPFVFLTAKSDHDDWRRGMNLGADDYLIKPFDYHELIQSVQARLDKQNLLETARQEETNALQSMIFTSLPQEFEIPLTIITEHVSLLRKLNPKQNADSPQVRILDSIDKAAGRLHRLAENYLLSMKLEMWQAEQGRVNQLRHSSVPTPAIHIEEIVQERALEYAREHDLKSVLQNHTIYMTITHLKKLVYELIDNAFKFSPVRTVVKVETSLSEQGYTLRVSNQGPKISQEQIDSIKQRLMPDRRAENQEAFGLGLLLSQQICMLYGGTLYIDSKSNEGTAVYAILPTTYQPM